LHSEALWTDTTAYDLRRHDALRLTRVIWTPCSPSDSCSPFSC